MGSEKTIEEKFKELYPYTDINSEESVGSYYCFEEGYKLAKEEEKAKIKKLTDALHFYAQMDNWLAHGSLNFTRIMSSDWESVHINMSNPDVGGKLARQILKEIE